ncbi:MAG: tetratricopeptide repeat protein [Thermoanaerobaculum sp.]|nr:tetratricopeptide repeat protein [Thermoanaerobaculum sp.]
MFTALAVSLIPLVRVGDQRASGEIALGDAVFNLKGDLAGALRHYQRACELAPSSAEAHFRRAAALARLQRWEESEQAFAVAAQQAPLWAELFREWGRMRLEQGQASAALAVLQRTTELAPEDGEGLRLYADALFRLGRVVEAVAAYHAALERKADDAVIANNLGAAYARLGRQQEAERWFQQAAQRDPSYAQPWVNLAKLYMSLGRREEAWRCLSTALERESQHPEALRFKERWQKDAAGVPRERGLLPPSPEAKTKP